MSNQSVFKDFTNLYELSKTLRFELKPVGKTLRMLEDAKVFKTDELIQKKYEQTKPFINKLHQEFVKESLEGRSLEGLESYQDILKEWQKDKKDKIAQKNLGIKEKELYKQVTQLFNAKAKEWSEPYAHLGLKKKDIGILFEEGVFKILKEKYNNDKDAKITNKVTGEIFFEDFWKGFVGYFQKFFETRKNFYKDDGTSTAIATRIVAQNLKRFCDNIGLFEKIKDQIDSSEVEQSFGISMEKVFSLDFYNQCLLQGGIDKYNEILGGKTLENGEKFKGINELINKYRQDNKGDKSSFLKILDKQILSEKESFIDEIKNDKELEETLKNLHETAKVKTKIFGTLFEDFIGNNTKYDLAKIYISKEAFNTISHKWTGGTDLFAENLFNALKDEQILKSSAKKKDGSYVFPDFIEFLHIKTALENVPKDINFWKERYYVNKEGENKEFFLGNGEIWQQFLQIFNFEFNELFQKEIIDNQTGKKMHIGYKVYKEEISKLLEDFKVDKDSTVIIKHFADSVLWIYQMAKYFALEKKRTWRDEYDLDTFYTDPKNGYLAFYENAYEEIVQIYNKLRNYLTKKPYSTEKWKLNFQNSTLASGWDKNKEADNFTVILRKDGKYFLGLMRKGANKLFDKRYGSEFSQGLEKGKYEKMNYKYFPSPSKMIPKTSTQVHEVKKHFKNSSEPFFLEESSSLGKFIKQLKITKEVFDLNNFEYKKSYLSTLNGESPDESQRVKADSKKTGQVKLFQKEFLNLSQNELLYKKSLFAWVDFCKEYLDCFPSTGDGFLQFKKYIQDTEKYESIDQFYKDIERGGYKISFQNISEEYISCKNQNSELYLFKIHNKDWNLKDGKPKTGMKNLHTMYFESLFSSENIAQNFPMKLNGQAEIFYRPKTDINKLEMKKDSKGKNVVDHKRYEEDKIFFHLPMTLNRGKSLFNFNVQLNNFLADNPEINIIGVDRGEKHLAYYSVINQNQEILDGGTLNVVKGGNGKDIDYHKKLEDKAEKREQARKDWQDVEGIKDLKKGYISQVVRKLADLAIEHNAIIVFEDLNMRFKQIRGGIEKSVYQQLEKALIEKLSFLVRKNEKNPEEAGYLLKAYQLSAPFETFQRIGKQTGIIFYTQASYTSKIDPLTGWRPNLYLKYSNAKKAKADISKFSEIEFINNRFEFTYDLQEFRSQKDKKKEYPKKTLWTLCSSVERYRWNRKLNDNKGGYEHYSDLTSDFKKLFKKYNININEDILGQIENMDTDDRKNNARFFSGFMFFWNLICQIRNTNSDVISGESDNDFILSPVEPFFDSRKASQFGSDLPENGDDNGAFNIARKGIMILKKISQYVEENENCDKLKWGDLYISHTDWDNFI